MWFLLGAPENDRFASCFLITTFRNDEQEKCTFEPPQTGRMAITRRRCERPGGGTEELTFHQMTITKKAPRLFLIRSNALK